MNLKTGEECMKIACNIYIFYRCCLKIYIALYIYNMYPFFICKNIVQVDDVFSTVFVTDVFVCLSLSLSLTHFFCFFNFCTSYDPGQSMFILVDDEIASDGILATPDIASEVRGKAREMTEKKKRRRGGGDINNTSVSDNKPINLSEAKEPSGPPSAAGMVAAMASKIQQRSQNASDHEGGGGGNRGRSGSVVDEDTLNKRKQLRNKNRRWVEAVVVRFVGEPGRHQLSICMGPPLNPTSTTLEGLIIPLTPTNHFSFPVNTSRPPLRTKHLPAPDLDINERRIELNMVQELLACKVCVPFIHFFF
jgi:hypothetical protein